MIKLMRLRIVFFSFLRYASAYTWQFTSQPFQCQNLSIAIQGSGQPPYSLLLVPSGPSPLPNKVEVRLPQNIPFTGTSTSLSFNLNYPENSSFVVVVSDSSGFGTGGTSAPVTVLHSSNSSCYDPTEGISFPWNFYFGTNGLVQCESLLWWWYPSQVNGTVSFIGVIPGGDSFNIPQGTLSTVDPSISGPTQPGIGFDWTVDVTSGTNLIFVGNDDRGIGSGGFVGYTIGPFPNSSCLSSTSPSSTPGSPAGGSYTSTSTSSSTSSPSTSRNISNTGAIAGGVAGGLVAILALALIAFFYPRRRYYSSVSRERPVNVLHDDEDIYPHGLPHYYVPEPYLVPDPTTGGTSTSEFTSTYDRPISMATTDTPSPQTPVGMSAVTNTTRKTGPLAQPRPVNIIQHNDAGPSEWPTGVVEPETIELPPVYADILPAQRPPGTASTPTTASIPAPTKKTASRHPHYTQSATSPDPRHIS